MIEWSSQRQFRAQRIPTTRLTSLFHVEGAMKIYSKGVFHFNCDNYWQEFAQNCSGSCEAIP